jgi:hypothetical protein
MAMTPQITPEMRDALNQSPGRVLVEDGATRRTYLLVDPTYFDKLFDPDDLTAIRKGIDDFEHGRKSSLDDAIADIMARHREVRAQ